MNVATDVMKKKILFVEFFLFRRRHCSYNICGSVRIDFFVALPSFLLTAPNRLVEARLDSARAIIGGHIPSKLSNNIPNGSDNRHSPC